MTKPFTIFSHNSLVCFKKLQTADVTEDDDNEVEETLATFLDTINEDEDVDIDFFEDSDYEQYDIFSNVVIHNLRNQKIPFEVSKIVCVIQFT